MRIHIPCMAHVIEHALGTCMTSLGLKGCTKSWEAHERDLQFRHNESTVIAKRQRLRKEGNAWVNKVSAMWPGFAKILEKVHHWRHFERPETDLHIAENDGCINYSDTRSLNRDHWLSTNESTNDSTTNYGCETTVDFNTGVAWASLPIMIIHLWVAQESQIHYLPPTIDNTGWMDHRQVHHGSYMAFPILDPEDVRKAYSNSASRYQCLQWHVPTYGWRYASFGQEEDWM